MLALLAPAFSFCATGKLIWSDEFNGPAGSPPNSSKWVFELGHNGWGNAELETYSDSPDNCRLDGAGHLVVEARLTQPATYTSARIKTLSKFTFQYGRVESRIRVASGQGLWSAFWLLGANVAGVGWPASGEIDIMENLGRDPSAVHGTIHGPGYSGGKGIGKPYRLPDKQRFADDFHVYAIDWVANRIAFFVDGNLYHTVAPSSLPKGTKWVFDHPFYLILNLAVGGIWPRNPDATTVFPQQMVIDYVRVYEPATR